MPVSHHFPRLVVPLVLILPGFCRCCCRLCAQGTADAVRQYSWLFRDIKNRNVEEIVILSGDHLYRMDYMKVRQGAYRLHCLDCQCRPG